MSIWATPTRHGRGVWTTAAIWEQLTSAITSQQGRAVPALGRVTSAEVLSARPEKATKWLPAAGGGHWEASVDTARGRFSIEALSA